MGIFHIVGNDRQNLRNVVFFEDFQDLSLLGRTTQRAGIIVAHYDVDGVFHIIIIINNNSIRVNLLYKRQMSSRRESLRFYCKFLFFRVLRKIFFLGNSP
jgi:hypothetical protein